VKERHAKIARETNNKPAWEAAATKLAHEYETPLQNRSISSITISDGQNNSVVSSIGSRNTRGIGRISQRSSSASNGVGSGGRRNQVKTKIKVVKTVSELKIALQLGVFSSKNPNMPSENIRAEKKLEDLDNNQPKRIIAFAAVAVQSICKLLLPNDDEKLAYKVAQKLSNNENSHYNIDLFDNLMALATRLPQQSLQRLALIAPACETFKEDFNGKRESRKRRHFEDTPKKYAPILSPIHHHNVQ
jgi:hypothetical protein